MSSWGFSHFLMPVSVQQLRVEIVTFNCRYILRYPQSCNFFRKDKTVVVGFVFGWLLIFFVILYFCYILLTHGDIEVNPGLKKNCRIFSARSSAWCKYDISNNEGVQIDSVTSIHDREHLIYKPVHIISNSSSCIDLIFTNQANLVVDSGTHPSLLPNCHHQIIHCKINFQVEYPPPYQRHVWHYAKASKDTILSALKFTKWYQTKRFHKFCSK